MFLINTLKIWLQSGVEYLTFNPLNDNLNPIYHLLALLGAHLILHVSSVRVKNRASYIYIYTGRAYRYSPDVAFYIFFSTNISIQYFKHATHSPFFSSKCRLFHNATFFGTCIIHILHTGVLKFKCKTSVPKINLLHCFK